jgi:hypothetical protein
VHDVDEALALQELKGRVALLARSRARRAAGTARRSTAAKASASTLCFSTLKSRASFYSRRATI